MSKRLSYLQLAVLDGYVVSNDMGHGVTKYLLSSGDADWVTVTRTVQSLVNRGLMEYGPHNLHPVYTTAKGVRALQAAIDRGAFESHGGIMSEPAEFRDANRVAAI